MLRKWDMTPALMWGSRALGQSSYWCMRLATVVHLRAIGHDWADALWMVWAMHRGRENGEVVVVEHGWLSRDRGSA
jgi:hypothetical protein